MTLNGLSMKFFFLENSNIYIKKRPDAGASTHGGFWKIDVHNLKIIKITYLMYLIYEIEKTDLITQKN